MQEEALYYNGKRIGHSELQAGFSRFFFERAPLGEGGNGVTFRVRHRILNTQQVVKVYFPGRNGVAIKAQLEAMKNADRRVSEVLALVHDAGTYEYPEPISFSVMESIDNIQTLREWIAQRNAMWEFALISNVDENRTSSDWLETRQRIVQAEALNVATGFMAAVVRLHSPLITHGDLNPGNILLPREQENPIWGEWKSATATYNKLEVAKLLEKFGSAKNWYTGGKPNEPRPGTLQPEKVRLIDLGSSQVEGTDATVGSSRETRFMIDDLKRIMKPFFPGAGNLLNWLNIEKKSVVRNGEKMDAFVTLAGAPVDHLALSGEIFRLLCALNVLLGHEHNSREPVTGAPSADLTLAMDDIGILHTLITGRPSDIRDDVFSLEALTAMQYVPIQSQRLINWSRVFHDWGERHAGFKKYEFSRGSIRIATIQPLI
ncbi:hypothetical protein [Pseudoclavibacter sp. AY1F1]|uniref:hypothetical protein n=1 Tax=Pseudoclavibacter sp. AY1F1 TaxID=2080583 RepID=UPI0011B03724|nr:hypothetical protein [Pseudoclavibacter sp. AY1F1]